MFQLIKTARSKLKRNKSYYKKLKAVENSEFFVVFLNFYILIELKD